ncbi:choice-of-anchor J domain-containing protein [Zunongwangia sp. SCSIO 43204]|nr:choice-of-anchor J domain-containing protein [Zunongwangia sp. SCSIO 43204]
MTTDDFNVPETQVPANVSIEGTQISLRAVKNNYDEETGDIFTFSGDQYFEAYVVSSDRAGNFYNELILQDRPENPEAGIQILIDENALYQRYNFGRKVFVKLNGLSISKSNGLIQLGKQNRGDLDPITPSEIDEYLVRSEIIEEITPQQIDIGDFSPEFLCTYIQLDNIQFNRNLFTQTNSTFAAETYDQFDGFRQIEECGSDDSALLATSTYADFRSVNLPASSGTILGVLGRDFYDDFYVVQLNSTEDLSFGSERCDPEFFDCGNNTEEGDTILFEENFAEITNENRLDPLGWTNLNVNGGEERFVDATSNGNRTLRISAYNTGENPLEAWLITPPIDLSQTRNEVLSFDIRASYDNGTILQVYISEDFNGDPETANWQLLEANIPMGPSNQNAVIFRNSKIDISCFTAEVYVGFRYQGRDPSRTTTYDIDNIKITAE